MAEFRDQAAFYGLLAKVRDMVLFLLSVKDLADESFVENGDSENNSRVREKDYNRQDTTLVCSHYNHGRATL